ncbi:MAG TPA: tRNA 2-thiouridine(34) synthase MnmA [Ruminococcaceae bacterium]|nr:tRNA 2-thiouridine(34) synthase MnmA [Oscillospiraceae bacterium]
MKQKLAVAMSGGVDSSVAAFLVSQWGVDLLGITMKNFDGADERDSLDAASVAHRLGFEHQTLDLTEEFRNTVMRYFCESYMKGETPNPCVFCNRVIKFGTMLEQAKKRGCDGIVSGHYAKIKQEDASGRVLLQRAEHREKDQSYVLWSLSQEQLAATYLPLGELSKAQVREIAAEQGFASSDKPDSQDICFIPDSNYRRFLEEFTGKTFPPGDFVGTDGKLWGRHKGIVGYTIGQRKGLGIAAPAPLFVVRKSVEENRVYLGPSEELFSKTLKARDINWIAVESVPASLRVTAKTRYSQREAAATVFQTAENEITVEFDEPQRAIAKGQSVVLYDGETVVGGGIITE